MPIRCFWELTRNINRISAQNDLRLLTVMRYSQAHDPEAINEFRDRMVLDIGEVFEYRATHEQLAHEKLDRAALHSL